MTFSEFLAWQEQDVKGIKAFEPGKLLSPGIEIPKTGFRNSGARVMKMVSAVGPAIPIGKSPGRIQPKSGVANK